MLDNSALDNTRIPWPKLLGTAMGAVIVGYTLLSFFPISPTIGMTAGAIVYGTFGVAFVIAFVVILFDHFAMVRTLRRGSVVTAVVAHTKRSTWGLGTGGQTWHVTLRYDIDGQTVESERSVPEEVYRRCHAGSHVEVRVMSRSPKRWAVGRLS